MYTRADKAEIVRLLGNCQQFLHKRKFKTIPANYAQLKEAALLQELRQEVRKLSELFAADPANEELIKSAFLKLCAEREEQNHGTCMSITASPEGICNGLYLDIAIVLFKPRHFGELAAILLPAMKASLTAVLEFSGAASLKAEEKLEVALKEEPFAAFAAYPAQRSVLTQVVTGDNVIFNLESIANLPLRLREQFHRLITRYPALKDKIYKHNDDLQQLWFDLELLNKHGATPGEMLRHLSNELSRAGARQTGAVYAANSVIVPCSQFRHYLDQLPSDLKEKLLAIRRAEGADSLNTVLEHLASGNCVEDAATRIRAMLENPANKELLNNHPGATKEQEEEIKQRYRKAIDVIGYENTNKLPEKLKKELLRNIKITSAYDFIDLLLNLPPEEYLSFLTHAAISCRPPLPARLDSALNMLNTEQTVAFYDALLACKEKFGGIWPIAFMAVKCNITKVFEKVVKAVPENERLITENGNYTILLACATQNSNPEIMKIVWDPLSVIERSGMTNRYTDYYHTPLHYAALNTNPEIFRTLLNYLPAHTRFTSLINKKGGAATPLDLAIKNSNPAVFLTIKECISEADYLRAITADGIDDIPLLYKVAGSRNPENLRSLIAYLKQHDLMHLLSWKSGRNILHIATNPEIVRILLAELNEQERKALLSDKDRFARTPLEIAAHANLEICSIMMEYLTDDERYTAFSNSYAWPSRDAANATPENWSRIWKLFKDKNKFASLFLEQRDGVAPLHLASRNTHTEIWRDLWDALTAAQRAVFVKTKVNMDQSLLQYLAEDSHFEAWSDVWKLHCDIERSAVLAAESADGNILHRVANNHNQQASVAILKCLSANNLLTALNIKNPGGNTPLHVAVNRNHSAFLSELLEWIPAKDRLKALTQKNQAGNSVLHKAANAEDCWRVIWKLLPAGDRLMALKDKNKNGDTPLQLAIAQHSAVTAMMLSPLSQQERTLVLSEKDPHNNTSLVIAILQSLNSEVWHYVWDYMPEPLRLLEIKEKKHGDTLLHLAANINKPGLVAAILRSLPVQDRLAALTELDADGNTPLHIAAGRNNEMLSCMLEYLPEQDHLTAIRMKSILGNSAVHCSAKSRDCADNFFVLLQALPDGVRSAVLEEKNDSGLNPVNLAIRLENDALLLKMSELLTSKESAILLKARDVQGNTSLHTAITQPRLFLMILNMLPEDERLLMLKEKNRAGDTPLNSKGRDWNAGDWSELCKLFTDKGQFASLFTSQARPTLFHTASSTNTVQDPAVQTSKLDI